MRFGYHHGRHGGCRDGFGRLAEAAIAMGWGRGGPEGFGRGGPRGEHGRGGRRRVFDGGQLRLVLLKLIADEPRHGYDLIRAIEERTGGAYAPSPGVVYPTLTLLGDMELVEEKADAGARRTFTITEAGTAHLAEKAEEVAELFARLDALGQAEQRTGSGPIRRGMANLHMAVRARAGGGEGDELFHQIAEILDEAARKIERL